MDRVDNVWSIATTVGHYRRPNKIIIIKIRVFFCSVWDKTFFHMPFCCPASFPMGTGSNLWLSFILACGIWTRISVWLNHNQSNTRIRFEKFFFCCKIHIFDKTRTNDDPQYFRSVVNSWCTQLRCYQWRLPLMPMLCLYVSLDICIGVCVSVHLIRQFSFVDSA